MKREVNVNMAIQVKKRTYRRSIPWLILVVMLAAGTSGCAHLLDYILFSPYITTKKLPNGTVGVDYHGKVKANSDLGADWWISDGQLPPGLVFRDSRISGTPTVGGTFKFEVTVSTGSTEVLNWDSKWYTVLILDVATQTLPDGTANHSYGPFTLESVGQAGIPSWSIIFGNLPDGISLTTAGVIAGTPTSAGTFSFTAKVIDQDLPPRSQNRDLSLTVLNPAPMSALLSPNSVAVGDPSFDLVVNGLHFVTTSVVTWNGADRPTTYASSTQLIAAIPSSDLSISGKASVAVRTPPPQGGVSNGLVFDVEPTSRSSFTLQRVSVDTQGNQANGPSGRPSISESGRYIVFESSASNLVSDDGNRASDIFLRDTCRNSGSKCRPFTIRVSIADDGTEADGPSYRPSISADGRYVAFVSSARNLIPDDDNSIQDVFVRDTCIGTNQMCEPKTFRVSVGSLGTEPNGASDFPTLSATGRYIVFSSEAGNLVSGDTNEAEDVFFRDSCFGAQTPCSPSIVRISLDERGQEFSGSSTNPTVSSDARFATFVVKASNLQIAYLHDTCQSISQACIPMTHRLSVVTRENPEWAPGFRPTISSNGRFIALAPGANPTPLGADRAAIVIRDTCLGTGSPCAPSILQVRVASNGNVANEETLAAIPENSGRYVVFTSRASDRNEFANVFITDTCLGSVKCSSATWRISRGTGGQESDADCTELALSPDGDVVAFTSAATNLVSDDTNGVADIYLYVRSKSKQK